MIVIQHSSYFFKIWQGFSANYVLIQGVTFFFVLSGFILTYTHSNLAGVSDSLRFIWARIARVWPAHIFVMAIFIILYGPVFNTGYDPTTLQFFLNATLLQAWDPYTSTFFAYNGVAWTLSVEMFFYALFPFLIYKFSSTWHLKILASIGLVFLGVFIAKATDSTVFTGEDTISNASWLYIWPPARLLEFVLGMVAGKAYLTYGHRLDRTALTSTISGISAVVIILFGAAHFPTLAYKLEALGLLSESGRGWYTVSGAAPLFAIGLFLISSEKGLIQKALSWQPLVLLGEISFSIYLTHQVIFRCIVMNPKWVEGWPNYIQMGAYWAFTLMISYLLWQLVEKPCQRAMRSIFKKKPVIKAALA
jgi:peptidoglycan/LPS O-acetylase OafA/YrhL